MVFIRHKVINILQLQGITTKLTRLIRMTLEDSQAKVVINMTENFDVDVRVRQGNAISFCFI